MSIRHLISVFFILSFYLINGYATTSNVEKYDSGVNSSIARQSDVIIEVHSSGFFNTLWYKVGIMLDGKIEWGESYQYANGVDASVAIKGNTVVEVHKSEYYNTLWYHVGIVDKNTKTISWGDTQMYDNGRNASVAISDDTVIDTHQRTKRFLDYCDSNNNCYYHYVYKLFYRTGTIDSNAKTIQWSYAKNYTYGRNPSVAVSGNTIIETHEASHSYDLLYRVGTLRSGVIEWDIVGSYNEEGIRPSIAVSGDLLVEMHRSLYSYNLWYHVGRINPITKTIKWGVSRPHKNGIYPSVSLDDHSIIEVHTSENFSFLYNNIGIVDANNAAIKWADNQVG